MWLRNSPQFCNNCSLFEHLNVRCIFSVHFLFICFFSVCGKHPPWNMWRGLLPCNETSCRSGIRINNPHRMLHIHVFRIALTSFCRWMWMQHLQTADRHFDESQRVWHIGCFTWANKLISSRSIKEILHISLHVTVGWNLICILSRCMMQLCVCWQ